MMNRVASRTRKRFRPDQSMMLASIGDLRGLVSDRRAGWRPQPAAALLAWQRLDAGDHPFARLPLDELEADACPGFQALQQRSLATLNSMVIAGHLRLATGPWLS